MSTTKYFTFCGLQKLESPYKIYNNTWTVKFHMFNLVLEKAEEPEIRLPTSARSSKKQESSRKTSISALLTMPKPLTMWITINCGKFWETLGSLDLCRWPQGASHGGSEKPGKLEVGGASRDSTGLGALEEGLISSWGRNRRVPLISDSDISSHQVAKVLEFQLQHQSFWWTPRTDLL